MKKITSNKYNSYSKNAYGFVEKSPFVLEKLIELPALKSTSKSKISAETLYFAICGSDYIHSATPPFKERFVGHEWVGITKKGELITTEVFWGCGKCHWCRKGMDRCCHYKHVFSLGDMGASLINVSLPRRNVSTLNLSLIKKFGLWMMTTLEPITVAYSIVEDLQNLTSNFKDYGNVLIIGGGFTGLSMGYLLKLRSVSVKFCEINKTRKSKLKKLGFRVANDKESEFDIVIDAAGERPVAGNSAFEQAVTRVRRCGIVVGSGKYVHSPQVTVGVMQNYGLTVMWPRGGKEKTLERLAITSPKDLVKLLRFLKKNSKEIFNVIELSDLPSFYTNKNQIPNTLRTIVQVDRLHKIS